MYTNITCRVSNLSKNKDDFYFIQNLFMLASSQIKGMPFAFPTFKQDHNLK